MCPRLRAVPRLSAETQSHLSRRWMPHPPRALCARPSGWGHDLAASVHGVPSRVHDPPALHLTRLGRLAERGPQPVTFTLAAIAPKCLHICGRVLTGPKPTLVSPAANLHIMLSL